MRKKALIISTSKYTYSSFNKLPATSLDAAALKQTLEDVCKFEIVGLSVNDESYVVGQKIDDFFSVEVDHDCSLLLYFSCHGIKSTDGEELYLACVNTPSEGGIISRSVQASFVTECLVKSNASQIIVILDCCYSGLFGNTIMKSDNQEEPFDEYVSPIGETATDVSGKSSPTSGKGIYIISSSKKYQKSFISPNDITGNSCFTKYLIKGLKSGDADNSKKGYITPQDIFKFIERKIDKDKGCNQNPQMWVVAESGDFSLVETIEQSKPNDLVTNIPLVEELTSTGQNFLIGHREGVYADLEILLLHSDLDTYTVEMKFNQSDSRSDNFLVRRKLFFCLDGFLNKDPGDSEYGKQLFQALFRDTDLVGYLNNAREKANELRVPLRMRLCISSNALEMNRIAWETLWDPGDESYLIHSRKIIFFRYLVSNNHNWRDVLLHKNASQNVLAIVPSSTAGDDSRRLYDISVDFITKIFDGYDIDILAENEYNQQVTLSDIVKKLNSNKKYDILYLNCDCSSDENEVKMLLDSDGRNNSVSGEQIQEELKKLLFPPRLMILSPLLCLKKEKEFGCGTYRKDVFNLAPIFASFGVANIISVQSCISVQTWQAFLRAFLIHLKNTKLIDVAVDNARRENEVRSSLDWWMPVLISRMRSPGMWYSPGFVNKQSAADTWETLISKIVSGKCVPILGPDFTKYIYGSKREISRSWADEYYFPLAIHNRKNLHHVAQYLSRIRTDDDYPRTKFNEFLLKKMTDRYADRHQNTDDWDLDKWVCTIANDRLENDENEPHSILAKLPFSIYLTTNADRILSKALRKEKKKPLECLYKWNKDLNIDSSGEYIKRKIDTGFDVSNPLVFHLFGQYHKENSVVLTEDDYFEYLLATGNVSTGFPHGVTAALNKSSLLFLGFKMHEWDFRILFKSFEHSEGKGLRKGVTHVSVQIDPDESSILDNQGTKEFLEKYFGKSNLNIFWGTTEDFLEQLKNNWNKR